MQSLVVQGCGPRDACVNSLIVLGARHLQVRLCAYWLADVVSIAYDRTISKDYSSHCTFFVLESIVICLRCNCAIGETAR